MKQIGALAIKNSAYILPESDDALEDFQWLLFEIKAGSGDGWIFRVSVVGGISDDDLRAAFRQARAEDYRELAAEATAAAAGSEGPDAASFQRLQKRFEGIGKIDFFSAPEKIEVEMLFDQIAKSLQHGPTLSLQDQTLAKLRGKTWVTRRGIKVDRIGSAWLIRRFIDPQAKFSFVDPEAYSHREGELRFDMFEGEFSHRGELCTFEVLLQESGIESAGLRAIAEIVHDIDLKEQKYQRPEAAGLAAMIGGLTRHASDLQRLDEGCVVFDALNAALTLSKI